MFDMINIFEVFLPQLLRYPNPTDPLNGEAAALLMREPKSYEAKVKGVLPRRDAMQLLTYLEQSTLPNTQVKKPQMKQEPSPTTTTTCPQ